MSTWLAVIAVYGFGVLGLLGLLGTALRRMMRFGDEAAKAEQAMERDSVLSAGPAIVVGVVETARDSDETVTVEISQFGEETENSGSWSHSWKERDRRVRVAPFYLRRPSGDRIRIEPTKEVFLVDDMDGHILVNQTERIRFAKLVPNEEVVAKGILRQDFDPESTSQAYRDAPRGWVMSGSGRGRPLFISSEPLAARFERMRSFHYRAAWWFFAFFLAMQAVHCSHHARILTGESDLAEIVKRYTYITTDDDDVETTHYALKVTTRWGGSYTSDISRDVYFDVQEGMRIPINHAGESRVQLGGRPTMHIFAVCFAALILVLLALFYRYRIRAKRPWYSSKVQNKGSGRLNASTGLVKPQGLRLADQDGDD